MTTLRVLKRPGGSKKPTEHSDTLTMTFEDSNGNRVERKVHQSLDARDFLGTAVYPYLIMGANPHLSAIEIWEWLQLQARNTAGAERPPSWLRKRRWMVQQPGDRLRPGAKPNADGRTPEALEFMAGNPGLSLRDIVVGLRGIGINRSRDWCRRHRVAGCLSVTQRSHK